MVLKPIWCKCRKQSWTRRQLYSAWERGGALICNNPECQRVIPEHILKELLIKIGMISPDVRSSLKVDDGS